MEAILKSAKQKVNARIQKRELDEATVAYHEAGHAIAAWRLSGRQHLYRVTIVPDADSLGSTYHDPFHGIRLDDGDDSPRVQRRAENAMLIALAGPAAQRRYNPRGFPASPPRKFNGQPLRFCE